MKAKHNFEHLVVDEKAIEEIKALAAHCPVDYSHLDWPTAQFVLAIWATAQWIETFSLTSPYEVKVGKRRETSEFDKD